MSSSKKKVVTRELKELKQFKNEADMVSFFEDERNDRLRYLTYQEYVEIFGRTIDSNFLPKINKRIIYGHFDYFNYCYDQTWEYKWYPLLALFAFKSLRFRSVSIVGSLAYLYSFDYFFENFFLQKYSNVRFIDVTKCFTYHLNKRKYISVRSRYLESYVDVVNRNIQNKVYDKVKLGAEGKYLIIGGKQRGLQALKSELDEDFEGLTDSSFDQQKIDADQEQMEYIKSNRAYVLLQQLSRYSTQAKMLLQRGDLGTVANDFLRGGVQSIIRNTLASVKAFQKEFAEYKQNIGSFPTRGDYAMLLYYQDLNQYKVYTFRDKIKERINESVDLFNFVFKKQVTKSKVSIVDFAHPERIDIIPTFKLESYTVDFLTFAIVCCLPFKVIRVRSKISQIIAKVRHQKSQFENV